VNKLEHSGAHPAKTSPRALTLTEFLAKEYPPEPPTPWGRFTTSDGTKYLFNRGYVCYAVRRPGEQPEPCEAIWPPDVVERSSSAARARGMDAGQRSLDRGDGPV
jgi:hypothetical protein